VAGTLGLFLHHACYAVEPFQESAKKSQARVEFHAAIAKARRNNILHVVFSVWDRIARNSTDAELLEDAMREGDLVLHVASGGMVLHKNSDDSDFFILCKERRRCPPHKRMKMSTFPRRPGRLRRARRPSFRSAPLV
jgi:hypothetical protein